MTANEIEHAIVPFPDSEGADFVLRPEYPSAWVTVDNVSVYIKREDGDVVVELYPHGHEMTEMLDVASVNTFLVGQVIKEFEQDDASDSTDSN